MMMMMMIIIIIKNLEASHLKYIPQRVSVATPGHCNNMFDSWVILT